MYIRRGAVTRDQLCYTCISAGENDFRWRNVVGQRVWLDKKFLCGSVDASSSNEITRLAGRLNRPDVSLWGVRTPEVLITSKHATSIPSILGIVGNASVDVGMRSKWNAPCPKITRDDSDEEQRQDKLIKEKVNNMRQKAIKARRSYRDLPIGRKMSILLFWAKRRIWRGI